MWPVRPMSRLLKSHFTLINLNLIHRATCGRGGVWTGLQDWRGHWRSLTEEPCPLPGRLPSHFTAGPCTHRGGASGAQPAGGRGRSRGPPGGGGTWKAFHPLGTERQAGTQEDVPRRGPTRGQSRAGHTSEPRQREVLARCSPRRRRGEEAGGHLQGTRPCGPGTPLSKVLKSPTPLHQSSARGQGPAAVASPTPGPCALGHATRRGYRGHSRRRPS